MADWLVSNWEGLILGLAFGSVPTAAWCNMVKEQEARERRRNER